MDTSDAEIKRRIEASPAWRDICTCMLGDHTGPWYRREKPTKCCTQCRGCGSRVKRGYEEEHQEKCVAYRELMS